MVTTAAVVVVLVASVHAMLSRAPWPGASPATTAIETPVEPHRTAVEDLIVRGRYLQNTKRFSEAHQFFDEALRLDPRNGRAMGGLSLALTHEGRIEEGIATARRALELDPGAADAYVTLAYWRKRAGDFEGAETYFRRAIENDPTNGKTHNRLARLLLEVGKVEDAAEHVGAVRRLEPLLPDGLDVAMAYELATGDFAAASRDADSWMRIWSKQVPDPSVAEPSVAEVYAMTGRFAEALALYRNLDPENTLFPAFVWARQGRVDEAKAAVRAFLARHPDPDSQPNDLLARVSATTGDFDQAFFYLGRLVDGREPYPLWVRYPTSAALRADRRWPALAVRLQREFLGGGAGDPSLHAATPAARASAN